MKNRTLEDRVTDRMEKCIHFNGVMNDVCKAGVNYDDTKPEVNQGIPCIKLNAKSYETRLAQCSKLTLHTREEAEAIVKRQDELMTQRVSELASGLCPTCKKKVKHTQVGSCVYGSCGHRLYQGKAIEEYE